MTQHAIATIVSHFSHYLAANSRPNVFPRRRKIPNANHTSIRFSTNGSSGFALFRITNRLQLAGNSGYFSSFMNRRTDTGPPFNHTLAKAIRRIAFAIYDSGFCSPFDFWNRRLKNSTRLPPYQPSRFIKTFCDSNHSWRSESLVPRCSFG